MQVSIYLLLILLTFLWLGAVFVQWVNSKAVYKDFNDWMDRQIENGRILVK